MTELCERCQERLGELLQWEIEHPATVALAPAASAPAVAPAQPPAPTRSRGASAASARSVAPSDSASFAAPAVARFVSPSAAAPTNPTVAESEAEQSEATPEEMRELWQHAQSCEECRRDLALLRGARQVLVALPSQAPPPNLRARVQAQLAPSANSTLAHAMPAEPGAPMQSPAPETILVRTVAAPVPALAGASAPGSRARWNFWDRAGASQSGPPLMLRQAGLPRAVWAGGGAVVAAFCLLLALQLKPPPANLAASQSDSDASSSPAASAPMKGAGAPNQDGAPGKAASTSARQANPQANPQPGASSSKPGEKPGAKPPGTASRAPVGSGAPSGSGAAGKASPSPSAPVIEPLPQPEAGIEDASPEPAMPTMPSVPPPPRPERPRPERSRNDSSQQRAPRILEKSDLRQDRNGSSVAAPARAREEAKAADIRIKVAPVPTARAKTSGTVAGSLSRASGGARLGGGSDALSGAQAPGNSANSGAPGGTGGRDASGGNARVKSDANLQDADEGSNSFASDGAATDSGVPALSPTPLRSRRTRRGAPLEAPQAPRSAQKSPAGPPGAAGEAATEGAPQVDSPPLVASPAPSGPATASSAATPRVAVADAKQEDRAQTAVRQVTVEVKAARAIGRARIEVTLAEGWAFGEGTGSRRVLWSGRARAGQVIRVQVGLKATRADAPERAARVRLLDAGASSNPLKSAERESGAADVLIPKAASGS